MNERDVEDRLIKPFFRNIGYDETDYEQQIRVPIGNHNNTLIPDFVIAHETYGGKHTAYVVVLLSAKFAVITSQEGIWITTSKVGYISFVNEFTWDELSDNDNMYQVRRVLGKEM